jgi:hypothetical protein
MKGFSLSSFTNINPRPKGYKHKNRINDILAIDIIQMPTFSFPVAAPYTNNKDESQSLNPSKKPRDRKKNAAPAPIPEEPAHEEPEEPEEPEEEIDKEVTSPTFPDMVILKQTDHNYIVKHNHYPITSSSHNSTPITDLVSPNQIHKGQINKKRGRKPKAGFILNSNSGLYDTSEVPNIILHLKCHLSDLKTNESISSYEYTPAIGEVESYTLTSNFLQSSDICHPKNDIDTDRDDDDNDDDDADCMDNNVRGHCVNDNRNMYADTDTRGGVDGMKDVVNAAANTHLDAATGATAAATSTGGTRDTGRVKYPHKTSSANDGKLVSMKRVAVNDSAIQVLNERNQKEIMKKINRLKYSFHNGETIQTKINDKSACFWDTCEFDGPIYYIPIMIVNGVFQVNGCYCSPECAVAALLKEPLDTSSKFERLHLLHLLYGTPSGKGFKPAPNPNYLLDKYYGNLTIHEYRALLKGPQIIHIVNKPLTHILPELYEDNNDFLVNSKVIPTNSLKMKKRYKTMVVQGGGE